MGICSVCRGVLPDGELAPVSVNGHRIGSACKGCEETVLDGAEKRMVEFGGRE